MSVLPRRQHRRQVPGAVHEYCSCAFIAALRQDYVDCGQQHRAYECSTWIVRVSQQYFELWTLSICCDDATIIWTITYSSSKQEIIHYHDSHVHCQHEEQLQRSALRHARGRRCIRGRQVHAASPGQY